MTPADYRRQLQSLQRRLQTAALAGSPPPAVFTPDYGLIWLELPAGNDSRWAELRDWQQHLPQECWLLAIAPFYLPLTGDDWAGFPRQERFDERAAERDVVLLPGPTGDPLLLCRDPEAALTRLEAAEQEARDQVLRRMTAITADLPRLTEIPIHDCWHCADGQPHNCVGTDCVNFTKQKQRSD